MGYKKISDQEWASLLNRLENIFNGKSGLKIKSIYDYVSTRFEEKNLREVVDKIGDVRPYVLSKISEEAYQTFCDYSLDEEVVLPFPCISLEAAGNNHLGTVTNGSVNFDVVCIIIRKMSADNCMFFAMCLSEEKKGEPKIPMTSVFDTIMLRELGENIPHLMIYQMAINILNLIKSSTSEERDSREKLSVNVKRDGFSRTINRRINKVVYIKPNLTPVKNENSVSLSREFSHRWEVGGHWRKIKSVFGYGPNGEITNGKTWVKNHVKGPADKELVKKVRVKK
jgi:hypothetical protein